MSWLRYSEGEKAKAEREGEVDLRKEAEGAGIVEEQQRVGEAVRIVEAAILASLGLQASPLKALDHPLQTLGPTLKAIRDKRIERLGERA